jgi:AraC-like DNA-binding protein
MSTALAVRHGPFGRAALYKLNRAFLTHAHREGHLTFWVRGQPACITVAGGALRLDFGNALAINPWQPHSFEPGDFDDWVVALVLYIRPDWFRGETWAGEGLEFGRPAVAMTVGLDRLVDRVVAQLTGEDGSNGFDQHLYDLTYACQEQTWSNAVDRVPLDRRLVYRDFRIRNSIRLMQERIGDELAIDTIARDAGLSRPHFYKLFRQHVGITPNIYLNTLRMESALDRLTRTADPVTAIGLDLGFASQASFTRFFTTNVGVPPTDYRRVVSLN